MLQNLFTLVFNTNLGKALIVIPIFSNNPISVQPLISVDTKTLLDFFEPVTEVLYNPEAPPLDAMAAISLLESAKPIIYVLHSSFDAMSVIACSESGFLYKVSNTGIYAFKLTDDTFAGKVVHQSDVIEIIYTETAKKIGRTVEEIYEIGEKISNAVDDRLPVTLVPVGVSSGVRPVKDKAIS